MRKTASKFHTSESTDTHQHHRHSSDSPLGLDPRDDSHQKRRSSHHNVDYDSSSHMRRHKNEEAMTVPHHCHRKQTYQFSTARKSLLIARNFKSNHITRKSRIKRYSYDKNYATESEQRNADSTTNSPAAKPKHSHFDQFYESFHQLNGDNVIRTEQNSPRQLLEGDCGRNLKK